MKQFLSNYSEEIIAIFGFCAFLVYVSIANIYWK